MSLAVDVLSYLQWLGISMLIVGASLIAAAILLALHRPCRHKRKTATLWRYGLGPYSTATLFQWEIRCARRGCEYTDLGDVFEVPEGGIVKVPGEFVHVEHRNLDVV